MIKEKISSALICFIILPLFSQSVKFSQNDFYSKKYHIEKSFIDKGDFVDSFAFFLQLSMLELSITTFNNKQSRKSISLNKDVFDRKGRLIEQMNLKDTGKKQKISKLNIRSFNENGKIAYSSHYYFGHNYFKIYEYNDSLKLVKQIYYNHKGIYSTIETKYDNGNMNYSKIYRGRKGRIISRYHYYYYPNKQIRLIELSNKRGEILKVWDYACDETGKGLKKLKDTAKICTIKSYLPDGTVVITSQSFDFSGKVWKTIDYTNAEGKSIKFQYFIGKEERLIYEYNYIYSDLKLESKSEFYYYFRHQSTKKYIVYDTSGRIVSEISKSFYKQRMMKEFKTSYIYNEQGLITEKNVFVNDRLKTNEKYKYQFLIKR